MSSTCQSVHVSICLVKESRRVWLRFEGPGKLHKRHWHMAKPFPPNTWATLCGIVVLHAELADAPGEGPTCATCTAIANRPVGGYL
jgi:hypothetical protein